MNLVMTLLVRDEVDIVSTNLDYHFAQGVDWAIVTDNRSVDGTTEVLREYERAGRIKLILEDGEDFSAWRWRTRMSRLATEAGADWIIPNDADEFWWPVRGTLKSTFEGYPGTTGIVRARRLQFCPRPLDDRAFFERMTLRWVNSKKTLGNKNKAAHRGVLTAKVTQGAHRIGAVPGDKLEDRSLRTFHFPWRSYEQFEQKVITLGRAYRQNIELPYAVGRLRRGLYELWEQGELESYYAEQLAVGSGGGEGIVEDPLLRDFMRSILTREETESQPGSPEDAAQELSGRP